ncbi:MAG: c-type cytochrome [Trueperaceae bacterium]
MFRQQVLIGGLTAFLMAGIIGSSAFAQVSVAEHEEHGPHLVDGEGKSLYVFLGDAEVEGSACDASCAAAWPPLTTTDGADEGAEADESLLGTIERADGTLQVSYDGWPLYHYLADRSAGSTAGQALGEEWYLIAPDGTVIGADLASTGEEVEDEESASQAEGDIDLEALMAEGESIYSSMCAGCHGANGDEVNASHVTRITEADSTVGDAPRLIRQIIYGGAYMPSFGNVLSNEQVQAISTYVRNSFGHDFGPVTDEEVVTERERFD